MVVNIVSITSGAILTFISLLFNFIHNRKLTKIEEKKLNFEIIYKTKLQIYTDLMRDFAMIIQDCNLETQQKFLISVSKASLICQGISGKKLKEVIDLFAEKEYENGIKLFKENITRISTEFAFTEEEITK